MPQVDGEFIKKYREEFKEEYGAYPEEKVFIDIPGLVTKEDKLALRYNTGKAPLSMVMEAKEALNGCAGVLQFGAKKYGRGNWHKGLPHTEVCDSMLRHISSYLSGENLDQESGLPHVDHILTNALFLAQGFRTHPELDDRSKELIVENPSDS